MTSEEQLLRLCDQRKMKVLNSLKRLKVGISLSKENAEFQRLTEDGGLIPLGYVALDEGVWVDEDYLPRYFVDERAGDFDFEGDQDALLFGDKQAIFDCYDRLRNSISLAKWSESIELVDELYNSVGRLDYYDRFSREEIDGIFDELQDSFGFLIAADFHSIWTSGITDILDYQAFREVDRRIAEGILANPRTLDSIDPRFFEELVASIFSSMGFDVFLTARTRDGGRDVVAVGDRNNILLKFIIECKRYRRDRKVSVAQVRQLFGVKVSEGASKAILTTTSSFTQDAIQFAAKHIWDLQLIDHQQLVLMIKKYVKKA